MLSKKFNKADYSVFFWVKLFLKLKISEDRMEKRNAILFNKTTINNFSIYWRLYLLKHELVSEMDTDVRSRC